MSASGPRVAPGAAHLLALGVAGRTTIAPLKRSGGLRIGRASWSRREGWATFAVAPFAAVCSLYGVAERPDPDAPIPRAARAAAAAPATPPDYRGCGPRALPETGVQGQVPKADQVSGRSKLGYRCNVRLVGQDNIRSRGANIQLAWYRDCAYVSIIGVREFFPDTANPQLEGIAVIDASRPRRPELVRILRSPVGRNQHEGIEVNPRRGMLVAQIGGVSARYIEIYDVSEGCRRPELKARYDSGEPTFHGLRISDDGNTIYATDGIGQGTPERALHVIDVSDMSQPRLVANWGPPEDGQAFSLIHDLEVSPDGRRAYLGASPAETATGPGLGTAPVNEAVTGPTVVTVDTSDIVDRRPNPDLRVISRVDTPNFGHTVQRARIGGKPYIIASGESPFASGRNCPWAWGHLIDMSDEHNPEVVSQLKLEVNETRNCERTNEDDVTYSIHYVGVDDERRTTKVFYTYYGGGLRVFDVRDPAHPKEIAYYHPPPQKQTVLQPLAGTFGGDAQTPAWDSATSVVRYRPQTGEIWFASIGGGLNVVKLTGRYACLRADARARGSHLGQAALGRPRAKQRATLPARPRARGGRRGLDTYCTTDARELRVGYSTTRLMRELPRPERQRVRRRAVLVTSDSRFTSARGIRPGTKVSALRRRLGRERAVRIGDATWYLAPARNARLAFRTRRSRVRAIGIADRRLTSTPSRARRLLTSWRAN